MAFAPSRRRRGASAAANAESKSVDTQRSFLFYQSIDSVTAEQHGEFCLAEDIDYGFASETNSLPLNRVGFSAVARHYPIIFTSEPEGSPLGGVGVRTKENLFVEAVIGSMPYFEGAFATDYARTNIAKMQGKIRCPRGSQDYGFSDRRSRYACADVM